LVVHSVTPKVLVVLRFDSQHLHHLTVCELEPIATDLMSSLPAQLSVETYQNRMFYQTKLIFGPDEQTLLDVFDSVSIQRRSSPPFVHDERSYVPPPVRVFETVRVSVHVTVNVHAQVNEHANAYESARVNDFVNEYVQSLAHVTRDCSLVELIPSTVVAVALLAAQLQRVAAVQLALAPEQRTSLLHMVVVAPSTLVVPVVQR